MLLEFCGSLAGCCKVLAQVKVFETMKPVRMYAVSLYRLNLVLHAFPWKDTRRRAAQAREQRLFGHSLFEFFFHVVFYRCSFWSFTIVSLVAFLSLGSSTGQVGLRKGSEFLFCGHVWPVFD